MAVFVRSVQLAAWLSQRRWRLCMETGLMARRQPNNGIKLTNVATSERRRRTIDDGGVDGRGDHPRRRRV